jgi:hypothetical protein
MLTELELGPTARDNLTASEADDLGRKLEAGKENAPTRPHPKVRPVRRR